MGHFLVSLAAAAFGVVGTVRTTGLKILDTVTGGVRDRTVLITTTSSSAWSGNRCGLSVLLVAVEG